MADPIGITFAPTSDAAGQAKQNWQQSRGAPEAVQILSLHLPKFAGAKAISPDALLQSPGQTGDPVSDVVNSVLRDLGHTPFSQQAAAVGQSPESGGLAQLLSSVLNQPQTPHITPGVDQGATQAPNLNVTRDFAPFNQAPQPSLTPGPNAHALPQD